ncbi:MAG: helix-turn-helix transcriptional regulator [Actinobacteria bacterium]|nr:helix-turn-helix transcriptional regulator [Actinomycetota bacterium]
MKSYDEYCPIAMGAEAIGDRWTPLVLRELICGSERFSEIHRGIPRMSKTLLVQRLKQLERLGILERRPGPTYHLTPAGLDLEGVVWGMGLWAMQWLFGDPAKEHLDGAHLIWRVRQRIIPERLPQRRTVLRFDFPGASRGKCIWLLLDPEGSSVCDRDEGFDVDLRVTADIVEFMRVWAGRSTWRDAIEAGKLRLEGPRALTRDFPNWFALSPFAESKAAS